MARILILQEIPGPLQALRKSLEPHHELVFVKSLEEAVQILSSIKIDPIISRVHLERTSVFEFIKVVKQNSMLSATPFICFCGKQTRVARSLDAVLANAVEQMGADKYFSVDEFCSEEDCDFDRLREEIESCLTLKNSTGDDT